MLRAATSTLASGRAGGTDRGDEAYPRLDEAPD